MHELSIATGILETALAVADEHGARRVEEIEVEVGVMRLVVPESLEMAFAVLTEGTAAAGAKLKITEVPIRAKCVGCDADFSPALDNFACPGCGRADVDIVGGNDIILKSVACWSEDE